MCRFLVYKGKSEILLSKLILEPAHSILTQSYDSRLRLVRALPNGADALSTIVSNASQDTRRPHNGDGFGVGYYVPPALGPDPCIFTSTIPAWNCQNLARLASKTASRLIFAHVRATTEGQLSETNCHPFHHGPLMFMHNGGIGAWRLIKRRLVESLGDRWFLGVEGGTDSEWAFAVFLDCLERMGIDPDADYAAKGGFGHVALRAALRQTIERINAFIDAIPAEALEGVDTRSLLNFAVADGHSVVCSRYVGSKTDEAASLYFSSGTSWREVGKGEFKMERRDKGSDIVLVASEPLTFERDNWVIVPTNSTVTIHKQTVMIHPIIDKYYSYDPSHSRSAQYAAEKGLVSTAPGVAERRNGSVSPACALPRLDGSMVAERLRELQQEARGQA